jgi:hypothetical protein
VTPRGRVLALAALLGASNPAAAELQVVVDAEGRTRITDVAPDLPGPLDAATASDVEGLRGLWDDGLVGEPVEGSSDSSGEADRLRRALRAAVLDAQRGETARASAALEAVLRREPGRPEAHYFLALLARQRGRFDSAERHLRAFLAHAGDTFQPWRESAQRRLAALETERRLSEVAASRGPLRLVDVDSPHFRVQYDRELASGSPDYAANVLGFLESARRDVGGLLGIDPIEPTGVVLYAKASYLEAYRHRFSFETVGFFDGRIHVVSAAHPAGELRALLYHEYTHALFQERSGSHRPFWLNEGFAEVAEHLALGRPALTRSERGRLRTAIEAGKWIPLVELAPSFGGLNDRQARLAYLISTASAVWIEARTSPEERARLFDRLGDGIPADRVLLDVLGLDTAGLDAAVRREILAEFPSI